MKYKIEYSSENAEQDIAQIVDILLGGVERALRIYKDSQSDDREEKALDTFENLNENVASLGEKLDDFREVFSKTSPKK